MSEMKNKVERNVFIIDDDEAVRDSMSMLFESIGLPHQCFSSANDFFEVYDNSQRGCLVLDIRMPGMDGLELQEKLNESNCILPIIFITGHGDVPMAVEAMRRGALDFMRKPIQEQELLDRIEQGLLNEVGLRDDQDHYVNMIEKLVLLTAREKQIFEMVAEGQANKCIASELNISERTVEVHRSQVMKKLEVRNLASLVRFKIELERDKIAHTKV